MKEEYVKCFYEEKTKVTYKTMKTAKEAINHPCVYRCWMADGEIKAMAQLLHHGVQVRTIKSADERIAEAIKNGSVGKGYKDKRYVG